MNKDTTVTQQVRKGYAIELSRKNLAKDKKFYLFNVYVAGPDAGMTIPTDNPRTLIYDTVLVSSKEIINDGALFFKNKEDAV